MKYLDLFLLLSGCDCFFRSFPPSVTILAAHLPPSSSKQRPTFQASCGLVLSLLLLLLSLWSLPP